MMVIVFYLPIWFQVIKNVTAAKSGVMVTYFHRYIHTTPSNILHRIFHLSSRWYLPR